MAKLQGLSLNPAKISGTCGRLMCCLQYEEAAYEHLTKITPRVGSVVETKDGRGVVVDENLISGEMKVQMDKTPDAPPVSVNRTQVKPVRQGHSRRRGRDDENLRKIEKN